MANYDDYTLDDVYAAVDRAKENGTSFTVFSTFAGGGGSSTGYKLAGGDVRGVLEFQKIGVRTYLENYPNTKFFCKDIRNVTGEQILKRLKMKSGDLDIFDGSPPCPPFSMSGSKRKGWNKTKTVYGFKQTNIEDLSFDVARLVGEVKPKIFICENVKGMTMNYAHDHFQSIMDAFSKHGYEIGWRVLNSKNYGVPQGRERVFIVGIRDDVYKIITGNDLSPRVGRVNLYEEERLSIDDTTLKGIWPVENEIIPNLKDAIGELMTDDKNLIEHEEIMKSMQKQKRWKYLSLMPVDVPTYVELAQTVYAEMVKEKELDPDAPEPKYSGFQVRRVAWNRPSHTLTERGLQTGTAAHLHPQYHRSFTSIEAKRIMSLPNDYKLSGNLNERLARVGLMVAPKQMEHLARSINEKVLIPYKEKINA